MDSSAGTPHSAHAASIRPANADAPDPLAEWTARAARRGVTFTNAISADRLVVRPVVHPFAVTVDSADRGAADARRDAIEHLAALARPAARPNAASPAADPPTPRGEALYALVSSLRAENAHLKARVAEHEDDATTLAGIVGLREKQVADLRQENAVLRRCVEALKASLGYANRQKRQNAARPAEPPAGDPDWTAPMSLLPRGMR